MVKKSMLILALVIAVSLCFTTTIFADTFNQNIVFLDVPDNYWAKEQIEYFANQGIVNGYDDGSFKPEAGVTREEFCKLLVSAFRQPVEAPETQTFADVTKDTWSYPYVEMCREFLTGYANPFGGLPSFHPTEYATREDITVALIKMMGYNESDMTNQNFALRKFTDGGSISPNLLPYVSLACEKGIINGYPDGTFKPGNSISRAEVVVLLNRVTKQAVTDINAKMSKPNLKITYYPEVSTEDTAKIEGFVSDDYDKNPTVCVDGHKVNVVDGSWYFVKNLKVGENKITVTAENKNGLQTEETIIINYVSAPKLSLDMSGETKTVDRKSLRVSGTVYDAHDTNPTVTVNGKKATVSNGAFDCEIQLEEGKNKVEVIATNRYNLSTKVTEYIEYKPGTESNVSAKIRGFSIVTKVSQARDVEGDLVTKINYVQNEEEGTVIFNDDSQNIGAAHQLEPGDVFMFVADRDGCVSEYLVIAEINDEDEFVFVGDEAEIEAAITTNKYKTDFILGYIENDSRVTKSKGELVTVAGSDYLVTSSSHKYTCDTTRRSNMVIRVSDFMYDADYYETEYDEDGNATGNEYACPVLIRLVNDDVIDIYTSNARVTVNKKYR